MSLQGRHRSYETCWKRPGAVLRIDEPEKRLEELGVDVHFMPPAQFAAYFKSEAEKWAKVVRAAGIQGQ
jgi:tripartite-type tricarboxylate transporter receptor subunit TctC